MINKKKGIVYLVGAGPGAPGLITVKGLECIRRAEVIIYDRLVSASLLRHAGEQAELIYVGKSPGRHTLDQEDINRLLVEKASQGLIVTRLKGGDPFVFGRGGEEAVALAEQGLNFEVVPGITSAVAVPAYAGIPVTHRSLAADFTVVTGHEDPTKENSDLDWASLARTRGTLVILMGMGNLPFITKRLMEEGMDGQLPVALVHRGTEAAQITLTGTLLSIAEKAEQENLKHPAVIIIGKVVNLIGKMRWFEEKPLFGQRIVVSRAREQASYFAAELENLGAEAIEFPAIKIASPLDYKLFDLALENLELYRWVIFTSENGVKSFFKRLIETGKDVRDLKGADICAIGPKTKEALMAKGLKVSYMPSEYRAEAIVEQLKDKIFPGDKVLLPRADIARTMLPEELEKLGAKVESIVVYRTLRGDGDVAALVRLLKAKEIDMITFTSSSTVKNIVEMLGKDRASHLLKGVCLASIGPITSQTASDLGLSINLEAEEYTIKGLLEVIVKGVEEKKKRGIKR